jgi:hypothetical protein
MTLVFPRCNATPPSGMWDVRFAVRTAGGVARRWAGRRGGGALPAYSVVVPPPAEPGMPSASSGAAGPRLAPPNGSLVRRFGAWLVDWVLCGLVVFGLLPYDLVVEPGAQPPLFLGVPESSWVILAVFAVENLVLVSLTGATIGHRMLGLQVWQVRPGAFPLQVAVRTGLLCLLLPALIPSKDGRAYHDVLAGTRIVVRP